MALDGTRNRIECHSLCHSILLWLYLMISNQGPEFMACSDDDYAHVFLRFYHNFITGFITFLVKVVEGFANAYGN